MKPAMGSLEAKNSNNQTGLAHQTSLYNQQFIEDAVRTAIKLQNHIDKMYKVDFVKDLYLDELVDADGCLNKIMGMLSDVMGHAYVERLRMEGEL